MATQVERPNEEVDQGGSALAPASQVGIAASAKETTAVAVAETARALVQARYIMAMERPRSWDNVRAQVLRACDRSRFAEAALYRKPVGRGKHVEGLSVRFAEEAVRAMGNLNVSSVLVFDDDVQRIVRVTATDLESNAVHEQDITVQKTVERRELKEGQAAITVRRNSHGQIVYVVAATDDDLANKQNALISKALRNLVLRLLPADIQEEALDHIKGTLHAQTQRDPDAERKRVLDAFAKLNVPPSGLSELLGHDVAQCSPQEIIELRAIWQAINEGETTWHAVISEHREARQERGGNGNGGSGGGGQRRTAAVREAVAARAEEAASPSAAPDAEQPDHEPDDAAGTTSETATATYMCEVCGRNRVTDRSMPCAECAADSEHGGGKRGGKRK